MGGEAHLDQTDDHGITTVMATNTTGNMALLDGLLAANKLAPAARVVYASSEMARGLSGFNMTPKFATDDANGVLEHIYGRNSTTFHWRSTVAQLSSYAYAKLTGTLHLAQLAREQPGFYFASVSPGMTHSTAAVDSAPWLLKASAPLMLPMMKLTAQAHAPEVGAKRYVDVLLGTAAGEQPPSGAFIASAWFATGPVCDQAESCALAGCRSHAAPAGPQRGPAPTCSAPRDHVPRPSIEAPALADVAPTAPHLP